MGILRAGVRVGSSRLRLGMYLFGEDRPPEGDAKRTGLPGGGLCTEARRGLGCRGKMVGFGSGGASVVESSAITGEPFGVIVAWMEGYSCASTFADPGDKEPSSLCILSS